jgi:hypothetical protein
MFVDQAMDFFSLKVQYFASLLNRFTKQFSNNNSVVE